MRHKLTGGKVRRGLDEEYDAFENALPWWQEWSEGLGPVRGGGSLGQEPHGADWRGNDIDPHPGAPLIRRGRVYAVRAVAGFGRTAPRTFQFDLQVSLDAHAENDALGPERTGEDGGKNWKKSERHSPGA